MKKALLRSLPFRTGFLTALTAAGALALSVNACSKKKEATPEKTTSPAPSASATDPNADGKRLDRAVNDWKRRWERIDLENCEALLKDAADLELCKKAEGALAKVKEHASKLDKSQAAITAAGELILAAEAVVEKLRAANMANVAGTAGSAKPSALPVAKAAGSAKPKTAAAKPPAAKGGASAAALGSAAPRRDDPATKLVSSYERAARSAARYLGSFLQQGTLDVRKQAFTEVNRLVPLREKWLTLRDVVRQASLTERDADLKKQLRELEQKLRGSAPPPPGVSGTRPAAPPPAPKGDDGHEGHGH